MREPQIPGVGIAFEGLDDERRARLATFCAAHAPWYYDVDDPT